VTSACEQVRIKVVGKMSESLKAIQAIQCERNRKISSYSESGSSDWMSYYKLIVELAELRSQKNIERISKYHKEHPDFR